ncbi:hypothetical protein PSTG_02584 [Puccinia striiformis f. sp. tritici PST-78]|uniref:Uncharacterized protein n=1 Tax=Puccinia striiformis f. sp. tritici PST-78 TaxID=1165861 RepID=A0A0L0VYY6_9BASI|nr:hypothetical protein PSTG_02584 [Puccinia striiformis f. sp. tritici PST-78]
MSQLSYNLLARENPPAGYYLATESWRIHWLGPEPADLPPQIIQCTGKFKPFFSKKGSANGYETQMASSALDQSWPQRNNWRTGRTRNRRQAPEIFSDAVASQSPQMDWWIMRVSPEFNKSAKPKPNISSEAGFLAWINMIIKLGNDTANSCLELSMENPAITKKKSKTNAAARSYKLTQQAAQDVNTSKQPGLSQDHPN